tara:strand:- start:29533 stop:30840 length:1308 start_codon:yes stop_codon:yes gene_type:complete
MPRNGTGTYTLPYNWNDDLANGITIQAGRMMGQQDDIATGLTNSIAKDGQTPYTGNQSMGNNKITSLGNSTDARDAIPTAQVQNSSLFNLGTSSGVADAYTAAAVPAIAAYEATMSFRIKIHATNATTTPTLQLNGIGNPALDGVIKKIDTSGAEVALEIGDLDLGGIYDFQRNSANNAWILMNENNSAKATTSIFGKSLLPNPIKVSQNAANPTKDIDINAGVFEFDDGSGQANISALTKELDANFALGNNNGGIVAGQTLPASGTLYLFLVANPDLSITDVIGDLSSTGANIVTDPVIVANNLSIKTRLGSVLTDAANNITTARTIRLGLNDIYSDSLLTAAGYAMIPISVDNIFGLQNLVVQWGTGTSNNIVNFPTSFPNGVFNVQMTQNQIANVSIYGFHNLTTSSFISQAWDNNGTSVAGRAFNWLAIGY